MEIPEIKAFDTSSVPTSNPKAIESAYANNVGLAATPWDVRFLFSEIIIEGAGPRIEMRANVVMSIAHARALLDALAKNLPDMEKQASMNATGNPAVR